MCNHIVEKELICCEFVEFDFLRKAMLSLVKKLQNVGCIRLFDVSDEEYPALVRIFMLTLKKLNLRERKNLIQHQSQEHHYDPHNYVH